jgi:hypothetical protein
MTNTNSGMLRGVELYEQSSETFLLSSSLLKYKSSKQQAQNCYIDIQTSFRTKPRLNLTPRFSLNMQEPTIFI